MNLTPEQRRKLQRLLFPVLVLICLAGALLVLKGVPLEKGSETKTYGQGASPSQVLTPDRAWGQSLDLAGRRVISLAPRFATYRQAFSGEIELLLLSGEGPPTNEREIGERLLASQRIGSGEIADNVFLRFYLNRGQGLKTGQAYLIIRVRDRDQVSPLSLWLDQSPDWPWGPMDYLQLRGGLVQAIRGQGHLALAVQDQVVLASLWDGIFKTPWGVWLGLGAATLCLLLPAVILLPLRPQEKSGRVKAGWRKAIFTLLGLTFLLVALEGIGALVLHTVLPPSYPVARRILLGQATALKEQIYISQPYLGYIPTPNYSRDGFVQHNQDGYRGERVPLERTPGTLRILCLGGSTTYSSSVKSPEESYPAQLKKLLEAARPAPYQRVEVINGGLSSGTTAELLTHYHFKYHYYRPDIVIINTGGNDAVPALSPYYQPDYSHWRETMITLRPLPPHSRWLARSRLISIFIIKLFYPDLLDRALTYRGRRPAADWYAPQREGEAARGRTSNPAYAHNLEALIRLIMADGAKVLLVPFRPRTENKYTPDFAAQIESNNQTLLALAGKYNLLVAPFPAEVIPDDGWDDYVHLNAKGTQAKAKHICPYVLRLIPEIKRTSEG